MLNSRTFVQTCTICRRLPRVLLKSYTLLVTTLAMPSRGLKMPKNMLYPLWHYWNRLTLSWTHRKLKLNDFRMIFSLHRSMQVEPTFISMTFEITCTDHLILPPPSSVSLQTYYWLLSWMLVPLVPHFHLLIVNFLLLGITL